MFVIGEAEALDWVLTEERMAFRAHVKTVELAVGDRVAIYASRGTWHNPTRDRAQLAAIGSISRSVAEKEIAVGSETMPAWCELSFSMKLPSRDGVEFAPLVPRLSFITKKESWGTALRRTIVRLPERDLAVLEKALAAEIKRRS